MEYFISPTIPSEVADQIKLHIEKVGKPLLEPFYPKQIQTVLEAEELKGAFYLSTQVDYQQPILSWIEFNDEYIGEDIEFFTEDMGLSEDELDDEADPDLVYEHWVNNPAPSQTPNGKAYHLLEFFDLGPSSVVLDDLNLDHLLGYISFVDGPQPGSNYRGVTVSSPAALSALQWKLTDLNTGIKILAT